MADTGNHRIQIYNGEGKWLRKFGTSGTKDGQFNFPRGIAVADNIIYVADSGNNRIQIYEMRLVLTDSIN